MCLNDLGGFESTGSRRSDGLKSEKHRDRHEVGGKLTASDEDDDRHRSSHGSRHSHKASAAQQGNFLSLMMESNELYPPCDSGILQVYT